MWCLGFTLSPACNVTSHRVELVTSKWVCGSSVGVATPHIAARRVRPVKLRMGTEPAPNELMQSDDFLDRIRGINRADEISTTSGKIDALIPLASEDGNQQVRYSAISRLASLEMPDLSDDEKQRLLMTARFILTNDKESSCQSGAADLIAGLKLTEGFEDLVNAFHTTSDWMLQFSIASALGEMGDPRAFDFLVSILDNSEQANFLLLAGAIGSLGELGDPRAVEIVQRFAEHEDNAIRDRAGIALEMLTGKSATQ